MFLSACDFVEQKRMIEFLPQNITEAKKYYYII